MVAPFAGAWIEIAYGEEASDYAAVAPFAGAWIEIQNGSLLCEPFGSLPSRERGLKSLARMAYRVLRMTSLPSRERGLK